VATLINTTPLFTLIIAVGFLKERLNAVGLLGVILIIMGTICISVNDYKFEDFVIQR
jgi:drug/metabolite transporter (DMT)-like permease